MGDLDLDLEGQLLAMGFNPMWCLKTEHDCRNDPHFIIDTKDGREEIFPRSAHKGVTPEELGPPGDPCPSVDALETLKKLKKDLGVTGAHLDQAIEDLDDLNDRLRTTIMCAEPKCTAGRMVTCRNHTRVQK